MKITLRLPPPAVLIAGCMLLAFAVSEAHACSCAPPGSPCQAYASAQAVFIGAVIDSSMVEVEEKVEGRQFGYQQRLFRFAVHEAFSGIDGQDAEILTGMGGGDCGYGFQRGVVYLVYAYRDQRTGKLAASICSRTRPLEQAAEDLAWIREARRGKPGVTLSGEVRKYNRLSNDRPRGLPVAGVAVTVTRKGEGEAVARTLRTDAEGKFHLAGLSAGDYEVAVELPAGLFTHDPKRELKVGDRGCAAASFSVNADGRIGGRVIDAEGKPVPDVSLTILRADPSEPGPPQNADYAVTDKEGKFLVRGLPPGTYLFQITSDTRDGAPRPYEGAYHPGTTDPAQALRVMIGEGEGAEEIELRLPPPPREHAIAGSVVWPDGRPAAGVEIGWVMTENQRYRWRTRTDEKGHFTARFYGSHKFSLVAAAQGAGGKWYWAEVTIADPATEEGMMRLVLRPR